MSQSNAFTSVGTKFQRGDEASAQNWADIAEIQNIGGPNMSRNTIDVTSLDSDGGYNEFIAGFRDGGEVSLDMNFTIGGYGQLKADFEDEDKRHYQIIFPDSSSTTLQFEALVVRLGSGARVNDAVKANCTLKISGPVTLVS